MRRLPPRGVSRGIPPRCGVISRSFASAPNRPGASGASGASRLGIGFFLGVTAGASAAYTYARRTLVKEDDAQSDVVAERATVVEDDSVEHAALKHGWPLDSSATVHSKKSYAHAFDGRTRNPRWVMEKITPDTLAGPGTRKKSDFYEDEEVSWKHRSRLDAFRGSGYDRGHLVAAADQKGSQEEMDATFALSNISPQIGPGFNRDFWAKFEQFVRDAASESSSKAAYVATGPLFLPSRRDRGATDDGAIERVEGGSLPRPTEWEMRYPMLGEPPAMMAVPTHFFKVILVEGKDDTVSCAAFVLPNAPIPNNFPLRRFVVPLTDLEVVSGLEFFKRGLSGEERQTYERVERSFLTKTAKQLPGAGKIPSLPATSQRSPVQEVDGSGPKARKRWVAIRHLCETMACEVKASRWDRVEGKS